MHSASLAFEYEHLHHEATQLAGGLRDLAQRATVYRHIFRASQGNHAFPLIAAHGALWAGGQFRFAMQVGRWLAWQYPWSGALRKRKLDGLANFLDALRDINRQVCIDTYAQFHFTKQALASIPDFWRISGAGRVCLDAGSMVLRGMRERYAEAAGASRNAAPCSRPIFFTNKPRSWARLCSGRPLRLIGRRPNSSHSGRVFASPICRAELASPFAISPTNKNEFATACRRSTWLRKPAGRTSNIRCNPTACSTRRHSQRPITTSRKCGWPFSARSRRAAPEVKDPVPCLQCLPAEHTGKAAEKVPTTLLAFRVANGTRNRDLQIQNLAFCSANAKPGNELGNDENPVAPESRKTAVSDTPKPPTIAPDVVAVNAAWPTLPEAIKAGVLATIRVTGGA